MKVLKIGSKGEDVEAWQHFLIGQDLLEGNADGNFGPLTQKATIQFQKQNKLQQDGIVGNKTFGLAMQLGFSVIEDDDQGKYGPNWPPKPAFSPLVTNEERAEIFGKFDYKAAPLPGNPENIKILGNWQKENIIPVNIPQLKSIAGISKISFHRLAANQLIKLWKDWEDNNFLHLVITWAGSFAPRFIRGSSSILSNHAFGSAFDINVAWNQRGTIPALVGQKGSVRELVKIANANGFYWGGHFTRLDGMHFEVAEILKLV
jgi:hypothetical protein